MESVETNYPEAPSILLVEDDIRLAKLIHEYLRQHDLTVEVEHNGLTAVNRISERPPDLVILDIMLPVLDGFEICKAIRPDYHGLILILTARDDDVDEIVGLELGADDYVSKPVDPRVLLARIRALFRRRQVSVSGLTSASNKDSTMREFGRLSISKSSREVHLQSKPVVLTTSEFELLCILAERPGEIHSREVLFRRLRGIDYDGLDRSIDITISRLRKKLGDDSVSPRRIKTVRRQGYLFVADAW